MLISSEKANMRAEAAVDFARRHSWAKYPCLAAVSVIYSAEYIRLKICEATEKIRAAASAPFRPLGSRIAAAFLSSAFAFMSIPFSGAAVFAEEPESPEMQETKELPKPWTKLPPKPRTAATPEEIADKVTLAGLAKESEDYDITLNIRTLKKDVTADFRQSPRYLEDVISAFGDYGISTEELNIKPVDVSVYTTEEKYLLQLSEGYSADITLPIPEDMQNHLDDLKVIRLEDNGSIAILDGKINKDTISFNTEHFSIFALVSYKDPAVSVTAENIESGAGMTAAGSAPDAAISLGGTAFEEDRNRFKKDKKRKIYRIKRIAKENQLLLL
ncbi:MAG: hypothetical protein J5997_01930 [Oscillospiraceae bacterium]|nr:hypothetical protein [Oscillospiraceae bacterium]